MRKNIVVCVTGYDSEYESEIVDGIYDACQKNDINLLVFASLLRKPELNADRTLPESVVIGEAGIFKLINYDITDGIILLGDSFVTPDVISSVCSRAKQHNIPVININDPLHKTDGNIFLSDSAAMEFVVRHIVEDHHKTKINFIGGFEHNLQTEERLAAYKKVLGEHNIPIEEKRIGYGEFWVKACDVTKDFMNCSRDDWPEAIVCASDTMAIFCMDTLKEMGVCIPEDIIVTGFDGIKDSKLYSPTVTTVKRAFRTAGIMAVKLLLDYFESGVLLDQINVESELEKNGSCGCSPARKEDGNYLKNYEAQNLFIEFNTYVLEMNTKFGYASDSKELFSGTIGGAKFFKLKQMFICMDSDIENEEKTIERMSADNTDHIPAKMVSMVSYGHNVPVGTEFDTTALIPIDLLNRPEPVFYAFSPLYHKEVYLGYIAYEPSCTKGLSGDLFATYVLQIANNAGSFYMKNEMRYLVKKLEDLYERDPLTGLFNRRGMSRIAPLAEYAIKYNKKLTIVCADVDGLKKVNDTYGHEGGDTVIIRVAMAISQAFVPDAVCVRTGGDEFLAVFTSIESDNIDDMIGRIDSFLTDFNNNSGLPYTAGCSAAYVSRFIRDASEVDDMMQEADTKMYEVKLAKKTLRID